MRLKREWRPDRVKVEDSNNGTALVQQLRNEGYLEFQYVRVKGSKLERFIAQTDILQSDRVVFPTKAPWFEALKKELFVFPNGRHDDQVDSVTQFLHWVQTRWGGYVERHPVTGRPLGRPRPQGRPFRRWR